MSSAPGINLRTFYFIAATQTLSILGSTLAGLTVGIWIFAETGEVFPFAIVSIASVLPSILLGSHLGWLADRLDRRMVMAVADLGQAVTTLLLLLSFVSGAFQLWHLYVLALISATFRFMQQPAFRAAITTLIPPDLRTRANAILEMQNPLAGIVAPALAGVIYAFIGVEGALLADLASFALAFSALLLARFPPQRKSPSNGESIWRQAMAGWRYILASRLVLFTFLYFMFINFLVGGVLNVLIQPYLIARTGSEGAMGILLSLANVGMIIGGVAISAYRGKPRMLAVLVGISFVCISFVLLGIAREIYSLGLVMLIFGLPITMINALSVSLWQAKVPPELQGRFFAVRMQLMLMFQPIAYFFTGALTDSVFEPAVGSLGWQRFAPLVGDQPGAGMGLFILLSGLLATVATLALFAFPKLRRFEEHMPDFAVETEAAAPAEATASQP